LIQTSVILALALSPNLYDFVEAELVCSTRRLLSDAKRVVSALIDRLNYCYRIVWGYASPTPPGEADGELPACLLARWELLTLSR
jgi:hypothetical protein